MIETASKKWLAEPVVLLGTERKQLEQVVAEVAVGPEDIHGLVVVEVALLQNAAEIED